MSGCQKYFQYIMRQVCTIFVKFEKGERFDAEDAALTDPDFTGSFGENIGLCGRDKSLETTGD